MAFDIGRRVRAFLVMTVVVTVSAAIPAGAEQRPTVIELPPGFQPEGIAVQGDRFYVGSIPTGAIYSGSLSSGEGDILVPEQDERSAIGLSLRNGMLYVAGGDRGEAYVYDALTGVEIASFSLTDDATFINDVVATRDAVFFTDSVNPVLYKIPLEGDGFGAVETLPFSGDLVYEDGFNANGIDATPNGKMLFVVQSNTGELFTVSPNTGVATKVDLRGETVTQGDGILLDGKRLWVVQNRMNLLTLIQLDPAMTSGEIVSRSTHETFDVPTTVAKSGSRLVLVNARFDTTDPQPAAYWLSQIRAPG
jgi:outer membrane protein assembly factor BamB